MFATFFHELKAAGVPVTLREYLTLMEAMEKDVASRRVEDFYYLSRAALVKDERNLDKFDRVFGHVFKGLDLVEDALTAEIPIEWLKKLTEKYLTEEEKKQIEALGGLEKLLETLRQRLAEQKGRHQGGKKWIGTAGTSPFGAYGYNPEGVRIGQDKNRNFRAVKVWDKREFKDLAGDVELGTRNIKIALRRLRKFARTGAPDELDLDGTIKGTAHKGYLDILMRPERHNTIKVLLVPRRRRLDGLARQGDRGIVLRRQDRVQAFGASLFPQLPLRESVEAERAALDRDDADLGRAAHLSARLQGDLRRRRLDVALRDRRAGRFGRALQRGSGSGVDGARRRDLSVLRLAQSGARARMGHHRLDPRDAANSRRADVSADHRGFGRGDAGIGAVNWLNLCVAVE